MQAKITFLLFCLITGFQLEAQLFSFSQSDNRSITLEFQLESYKIDPLEIRGETLDVITAKNCGYINIKGEPALPYFAKSIIIPDIATPQIEISQVKVEEIKVNRIIPSNGPLPVGVTAENIPFEFGEVYQQDKWSPDVCAEIGEPYILRDFQGVVLNFYPFQYNPIQGVVKIVTSLTIKVTYGNHGNAIAKNPSHEFQNIYKNHFINFEQYESKYPAVNDVGDLMIITTAEFMSVIEPLATWKNRKGIPTTAYLYPDETGSTALEIKNFIQQVYNQTGTLTFILLVGDAEDIPPAAGYAGGSGYPADPVYTLLSGNDEYPDAFIGRFSVETPEEAAIVVNKNLWYEMNPDPSAEWYHKATGIASAEIFPPTPPDTVIVENIRQALLNYNYTYVDQIYDPGATYSELIEAIEDGRGLINYVGHGSSFGWGTTGMYNQLVTMLTNSYKTPVIVSTACNVSSFAGLKCFGEFWQRQGTTEEPQGAIAFMGCSITHYTLAGMAHPEMVNILVSDDYFTVGGFFTNGVMTAIDYDPGLGVGGGVQCFQSWILLGDPSLCMYTDIPSEMTAEYSGYLLCGDTCMNVMVYDDDLPVPDALVALYMNDSLLGSCYTNQAGLAEIILEDSIHEPGMMELNVTARNKIPVFETIQVITGIRELNLTHNLSIEPNPVTSRAVIEYFIHVQAEVQIDLVDINGRIVMNYLNQEKPGGIHREIIDFTRLRTGIYFCVLKTPQYTETRKIIKLN